MVSSLKSFEAQSPQPLSQTGFDIELLMTLSGKFLSNLPREPKPMTYHNISSLHASVWSRIALCMSSILVVERHLVLNISEEVVVIESETALLTTRCAFSVGDVKRYPDTGVPMSSLETLIDVSVVCCQTVLRCRPSSFRVP